MKGKQKTSGGAYIVGTEHNEGKRYPSDWPCVCKHSKKDHVDSPFNFGCLAQDKKFKVVDSCTKYRPIDNLSFVELLEKTRKV